MIQRRLQLQYLERRDLLAGDLETCTRFETSAAEVDATVHVMGSYTAAEAGSTRDSAANLGPLERPRRLRGELGGTDRIDMVRFEMSERGTLDLDLHRLNRNADLYLLDQDGKLIGRSTNSGTGSEAIDTELQAGDYYIAVVARTFQPIDYRLDVAASIMDPSPAEPIPTPPSDDPADSPPTADPPTTDPPAADPPVEQPGNPPAPVAPLADVPYFGGSRDWNVNSIGAPEAWAAGYRGQGVTVAVVDTGVDIDHPDLVNRLYVNPGEIAGNGIDDDQNGYVDDVSGYDFAAGDAHPNDINGHGTHVAGTIAAADNGVGVTGIAPEAKILPIRVLGDDGSGKSRDVAEGIRYAADMGAQIINLSLGGGYSRAIESAVRYAESLGSLIVAAAGNASASRPGYPARFSAQSDHVISVGAHDASGKIAAFSNRVGDSRSIQIDAPGVRILSTYAGGRYATLSGTSMATPHVSGLAALTLSSNPDLTSAELRELLSGGVIGSAGGSDSIGIGSTLRTVAYAAAGLTSVPAVTESRASMPTATDPGIVKAASATESHVAQQGVPQAELPLTNRPPVRSLPSVIFPEELNSRSLAFIASDATLRTASRGNASLQQIEQSTDQAFGQDDFDWHANPAELDFVSERLA